MLKCAFLGGILAMTVATSALAGDVVDIRHPSLRHPDHAMVVYWCLTKDQLPAEYQSHPHPDRPLPVEVSGAQIVTQLDSEIFLTSEECLDQTKNAVKAQGLDPAEFTYTTK